MTLRERIEADLTSAMKAHQVNTVSTLRMLQSAIKNAVIAARTSAKQELDDADVEQVIRSEAKKLRDALEDFSKAARQDLIDRANEELTVLQGYLPKQLDAETLEAKVREIVAELREQGEVEFGKAMKAVNDKIKGLADGKAISEAVKRALG